MIVPSSINNNMNTPTKDAIKAFVTSLTSTAQRKLLVALIASTLSTLGINTVNPELLDGFLANVGAFASFYVQ